MKKSRRLPQDALEEILSRLPVKPLARCKCISKSWYNLISSRNFVKKHLAQTRSNPSYNPFRILKYWPYESIDYESPFALKKAEDNDATEDIVDYVSPSALEGAEDDDANEDLKDYESPSILEDAEDDNDDAIEYLGDPLDPEDPYIDRLVIGSCDGLIALSYDFDRIILWNPSIKVARELPPSPSPYSNATSFYGFGYDNSIDDYKVVKVVCSNSTNETTAYIFCINGNCWRTIEGPDKSTVIHKIERCYCHGLVGVFLHGALHWLADRGASVEKLGIILHFDLTTERFSELPQPTIDDPSRTLEFLWILNDRLVLLAIAINNEPYSRHDIEIWVMNMYGIHSSWSKLFSIDDEFEYGVYGEYLDPVCFTRNGDLIIDIEGRSMMRYNIQEKTFQFFDIAFCKYEWNIYLQSMVSPYANDSVI